MEYSDELGREYEVREARFWREAQFAAKAGVGPVRLFEIGPQFGYSEQSIARVGRTWENDGLCVTSEGGRVILTLTHFGRTFTFEDRFGNIEE